ncbi:hypothetical protein EDD16DRAFT_1533477 [Pisolithus croceorrhizus]|nr:hypothetical protein EDD16DRAFT_1533477 [Pisolithus croceorrhizus]
MDDDSVRPIVYPTRRAGHGGRYSSSSGLKTVRDVTVLDKQTPQWSSAGSGVLQSERCVHCSLLVISPAYYCKIVCGLTFDCTIRYISVPNKSGIHFLGGRTMFTLPWSSYVFTHGETKINQADEGRVIKVNIAILVVVIENSRSRGQPLHTAGQRIAHQTQSRLHQKCTK